MKSRQEVIEVHLGKLKNQAFVDAYKSYGFSTKTQLFDAACDELRQKMAKEKRAKWREEAFDSYIKSQSEFAWESIDGGDFETH